MGLDAAALRHYREQGYIAPIRVMPEADALHYRAALEASEAKRGRPLNSRERIKPHLLFDWAAELTRHPGLLDAVESLIGPDILIWDSSLFTKEAGRPDYISWHQDMRYWGLDPSDCVLTAWLALSPSTVESGCMRVVPGSHLNDLVPHTNTKAPDNMLSYGQEVQAKVDDASAADLVLQPGEMSLHHSMIIHGSQPNRSGDRRLGYAMRFFPTSVRQLSVSRDRARLVRGTDRFHHFEVEPAPSVYDSAESEAVHAECLDFRNAAKKAIVQESAKA